MHWVLELLVSSYVLLNPKMLNACETLTYLIGWDDTKYPTKEVTEMEEKLGDEQKDGELDSSVVDMHSRRSFLKRALALGAASTALLLGSKTLIPEANASDYTLGTADDQITFEDSSGLWRFYSDGLYTFFMRDDFWGRSYFGTGGERNNDLALYVANSGKILYVDLTVAGTYALFHGGDLRVQKSNAELRLIGQEANARTWRLFADGTSFNFRDETGGKNILIVATDALQIGRRMVPVGDAVPGMDLGIVGARWSSVRAANVYSGDYNYENGWRTTEDSSGIAFLNSEGEKVASLDEQGNLHIKGKIIQDL